MNLVEYRNFLRVDLHDAAIAGETALWSEDELNRCIYRAMSDLSRFLPLEKIKEITLKFTVTDEAWTSAAAAATYVALGNKPIKYQSETVKNNAGTSCVRDTDYYIDYSNGKITHIADGRIGHAEECTISYTKSQVIVDTSSLTDLIRVSRVEYPVGKVPQSFASYNMIGDLLQIQGKTESQVQMTDGEHIAIYYQAHHVIPEKAVDSTCPAFLSSTVLLAASAYALLIRALEYEQQAATDIESSETELSTDTHDITEISAALDKVATYADGGAAPSVKYYLLAGDNYINTVNKGDNVPENHAVYAGRSADIATLFLNEATQRISSHSHYVSKSTNYIGTATQLLSLATMFREEAVERRNEAWSIWRDKKEYAGGFTMTSGRQPITQ